MKLRITELKEIDVDIDSFKKRAEIKGLYEDDEKAALLKIYGLFESGKFAEAIKVIKDMPDEWEGYVEEVVYDTLVDIQRGASVEIVK